jgi:hypothetical protein
MSLKDAAVVRAKLRLRDTMEMLSRAYNSHDEAAAEILRWGVGACIGAGMAREVVLEIAGEAASAAADAITDEKSSS